MNLLTSLLEQGQDTGLEYVLSMDEKMLKRSQDTNYQAIYNKEVIFFTGGENPLLYNSSKLLSQLKRSINSMRNTLVHPQSTTTYLNALLDYLYTDTVFTAEDILSDAGLQRPLIVDEIVRVAIALIEAYCRDKDFSLVNTPIVITEDGKMAVNSRKGLIIIRKEK